MTASEIRQKFLDFFAERGHKIVPSSSLIPNDPSVLLTTAGMQQFKSYYLDPTAAEKDFGAKNVVSIQKSFRTSDIDEVGDETHLTFFEMLGNFSFGGYFKEEAIKLAREFISQELGLKIDYVTIFSGDTQIPKDEESKKIWQKLSLADIRECGRTDNFWGPTGAEGPCGPTTEIYLGGKEIWNLVFNEYYRDANGQFEKLSTLGVDTGMGLERLAMIAQKKNNIFETDLFAPIMRLLPSSMSEMTKRIVADHLRAISFLISDDVIPSNKGAGYVLRRLIRRVLTHDFEEAKIIKMVVENYQSFYPELNESKILAIFNDEKIKYNQTLHLGLRELEKLPNVNANEAFKLYETHGLPFEAIKDKFPTLRRTDFDREFEKHQQRSRVGMDKKFAGGLADHAPATVRLHTAHHLLLAALKQVFGAGIKQRGSNINQERLRFDFSFGRKLTEEEKQKVEDLVNQKIKENLPVVRREMSRVEAEKLGAEMEFGQKYGEMVSVYTIGPSSSSEPAFSLEFCGGPHVARTGELIGVFKITKEEAVSAGVRRIKAVLG